MKRLVYLLGLAMFLLSGLKTVQAQKTDILSQTLKKTYFRYDVNVISSLPRILIDDFDPLAKIVRYKHNLGLEYQIGRRRLLGVSTFFYKGKYEEYVAPDDYVFVKTKGVSLYSKRFVRSKASGFAAYNNALVPTGFWMQTMLSSANYQADVYYEPYDSNAVKKHALDINCMVLSFGIGKQEYIFKHLLLDLGLQIGIPLTVLGKPEQKQFFRYDWGYERSAFKSYLYGRELLTFKAGLSLPGLAKTSRGFGKRR